MGVPVQQKQDELKLDDSTRVPEPTFAYVLHRDFTIVTPVDMCLKFQQVIMDKQLNGFLTHRVNVKNNFHTFTFTKEAKTMLDIPNAGGSSEKSEAFSYEVLNKLFGVKLLKAEMEIKYEWW